MSKTHCRNCKQTHEGIYAICPSCGFDMLGNATGTPTPNDTDEIDEAVRQFLSDFYGHPGIETPAAERKLKAALTRHIAKKVRETAISENEYYLALATHSGEVADTITLGSLKHAANDRLATLKKEDMEG